MRGNRNERGVALLTVITALVALMVIAVPFAITMRLGYERSEHNNARARAQHQVDSVLRFLEAYLVRTTERVEMENRANDVKDINSDPEADTQREIEPTIADIALALGMSQEELQDAYGTILGWRVEDENGKLNINSASFFALGNLLGLSLLGEELDAGEQTVTLEDATGFPDRGYVKVGRELIKYTGKEGNRLTGCERGVAAASPQHGGAETYKAGQWVVNYAAWAIAYYPVGRHPGEFTPFDNLDVSDISRLTELDPEVPVLTEAKWELVKPFVTAHSRGELMDGWANIQPVIEGTSLPGSRPEFDRFNYKGSSAFYNKGTVIRLEERTDLSDAERDASYNRKTILGRRRDYQMVYETNPAGRFENQMDLFGKVHRSFKGNQMRMYYRTRQPVNINTAPREVLVALFTHLKLVGRTDRVTPDEAGKVADEIIRRRESDKPLRGFEDFEDMLSDLQNKAGVITDIDHRAIYRNCLNSNDHDLEFGTAPICFKTFDVYTLRAAATLSDRGGRLLAKQVATRVVEIGSQLTASRIWETQRDYEDQLVASNDPRYWTTGPVNTGRFISARVEPWPRWPKQLNQHLFPWDPYGDERRTEHAYEDVSARKSQVSLNGDIRLSPGRHEYENAPEDARFVEHFDQNNYLEGNFVTSGYSLSLGGEILNALSSGRVRPFSLEFWWQPQSAGDQTIFDVGESEFRNRVALFVEGSEMVLRVADNSNIERASEIRYDVSELGGIREEIWYHVHIVVAGAHPSKMALIVDGRAVGRTTLLTHLTSSLNPEDGQLRVEDASGFPSRGAVQVGLEVIEYEQVNENTIVVRQNEDGEVKGRGARGSAAREHPEGVPVVMFGYARQLMFDQRAGGATLDGDLGPFTPILMDNEGGAANMFSNYSPAVTVHPIPLESDSSGAGAIGLPGPLAPLQGGGGGGDDTVTLNIFTIPYELGEHSGFNVTVYGRDSENDTIEDQITAFQEEGYCYLVFIGGNEDAFGDEESLRSNARHRVEFVKYYKDSDSASGFRFERVSGNDGAESIFEPEPDTEIMVGWQWVGGGLPPMDPQPVRVVMIPCSVRATQATSDAYPNPVQIDDPEMEFFVVQLVDGSGDQAQLREWIRYSEILRELFFLCGITNPELLADVANDPDYDTRLIDHITDAPDPGTTGDGDPSGGDPSGGGGTDPGGGGGTGPGGGGGTDPGGGGGTDPGGTPVDPGGAPPSDGSGGNTPNPDEPPPPSDGPGGGGNPPVDEPPPPPSDGPGGNPPTDEPPPPPGDGSSGNPPVDQPPSDPGDGSGGNLPPGEGGPPAPDGGGGDEPDPEDTEDPDFDPDPPEPEEDEAGTSADGTVYANNTADAVGDMLRHRGVQEDLNEDRGVNDWPKGEDGLTSSGAELIPVAAMYGGPQGEYACPTFLPGFGDIITICSGDDQIRFGEPSDTVAHAMRGDDRRLYEKTSFGLGGGDVAPFEFEHNVHLFALTRSTNQRIDADDDLDPRAVDQRDKTRVLAYPTGEHIDNVDALSAPLIAGNLRGEAFSAVIDEISGDRRGLRYALCVANEELTEEDDLLGVTSIEGTPNQGDVPDSVGLVRIGDELAIFREAELNGRVLELRGLVRGVMCTEARNYTAGAPVEILFGVRVGVLSEGLSDSSNQVVGEGLGRFPRIGVVRLEDPEAETAELIIYTENQTNVLKHPIGDTGGGVFRARYGTPARSWESGTAVIWQPFRYWDRFAEFNDDPEQGHWQFSTEMHDAYLKRVFWEETDMPPRLNIRVLLRLNEGIDWNATSRNVLFVSTDGAGTKELTVKEARRERGDNPLRFLRAYEVPDGDNLINVQADKIEARLQAIYEDGAYVWKNLAEVGWKSNFRVTMFGIEYVNQNRTRRHIDRGN